MSFHAARFDSRTNEDGEIVLLPDQDRSNWNQQLIGNGFYYFQLSGLDSFSSMYHIEAAIQSVHIAAISYEETDWAAILGLYKRLYAINPSPIVAMHMAVSMCKVHGPDAAIEILLRYPLTDHYLYHAILGHALEEAGRYSEAAEAFKNASLMTMNSREKALFDERFRKLSTISKNLLFTVA